MYIYVYIYIYIYTYVSAPRQGVQRPEAREAGEAPPRPNRNTRPHLHMFYTLR